MSANGPEPRCEMCDARASETPLFRKGDQWRCGAHALIAPKMSRRSGMILADWWAASLIAQYLLAAVLYGLQGQSWKALYWLSASGIGMAVLRLR